jgi:hypothetical protein
MAQKQLVKITNGDVEAHVLPAAVKAYERNGWTAVDDGSSEESKSEPAAAENATTRKAD